MIILIVVDLRASSLGKCIHFYIFMIIERDRNVPLTSLLHTSQGLVVIEKEEAGKVIVQSAVLQKHRERTIRVTSRLFNISPLRKRSCKLLHRTGFEPRPRILQENAWK